MASSNLSTYRKKRDFEKTAEPSGDVPVAPSRQRRFVIQKHDATRLHYDFRLEFDGVFKSWAVTRGPSLDPHDKRLAVEVEDHPLDYGDFEGTIPEGQYGGGTVQLWDRGTWESDDPDKGFAKGDLKFTLHGDKLQGSWVLVRMRHDRSGGKRTNWLLIKHRDEYAREGDDERHSRRRSFGRLRPQHGPDRRRQGQGAEAVHDAGSRPRQGRCGLAFEPGRGGGRTRARQKSGAAKGDESRPKCRSSSPLNYVRRSSSRRTEPAGATKSSSTAIACNCGSRTARRVEDAQGPRLDRQVPGDRESGRRTARCDDRWRDRCARS